MISQVFGPKPMCSKYACECSCEKEHISCAVLHATSSPEFKDIHISSSGIFTNVSVPKGIESLSEPITFTRYADQSALEKETDNIET